MASGVEVTRVPPHNIDAERSVLGSMLIDEHAVPAAVELLSPEHFYVDAHRRIFAAMCSLFESDQTIDLVTLCAQLEAEGALEAVGGKTYVASLLAATPSSATIESHARIVREKAILRSLIAAANQIVARSYEEQGDVDEYLDEVETLIYDIAEKKIQGQVYRIEDLVEEALERAEVLALSKGGVTGIPTGFRDLDINTGGLQPGELIIIAARPSQGKTALALNILTNAALHPKAYPVALFSLEMSREQITQRVLCSEARVNLHAMRHGMLSPSAFRSLEREAARIRKAPFYIDDTPGLTILELRAKARRLKAKYNVQLIAVDYIQLMQGRRRSESRQQEIAEISRGLKLLAKELSIPVLAMAQLSRKVEDRQERNPFARPQLSDLRESGALEQDADVCAFIHHPWNVGASAFEDAEGEDESLEGAGAGGAGVGRTRSRRVPRLGEAELIVAKQRNGPTCVIKLTFHKEYARFDDYSPRVGEP